MLLYQLFRPFSYITIRHPVKRWVDWYFPVGLTVIALCMLLPFRPQLNLWGIEGLFQNMQGFIQGLPGFYIAALAAVATFGQQTSLDMLIPAPTPTLKTNYGGHWMSMQLTRRRFLCLLFAYVTALSIILSLAIPYVRAIAVPLRECLSVMWGDVASIIITGLCLLITIQMIVVTLWGLYYLSDRMHQPEPYDEKNNV